MSMLIMYNYGWFGKLLDKIFFVSVNGVVLDRCGKEMGWCSVWNSTIKLTKNGRRRKDKVEPKWRTQLGGQYVRHFGGGSWI